MSASSDPKASSDVAFVACIESGPLEALTTTLFESLRRFGGGLSSSIVYAVVPRVGPPLGKRTRRALETLDCRLLALPTARPYAWYHFLNKAYAVAAVEELATTDIVAFLDSDVLVLQEPTDLRLGADADFAAVVERGSIEIGGPDHRHGDLWMALSNAVGLRFQDVPFLPDGTEPSGARVYWNSGVFAFRRAARLGSRYRACATALLDANLASRDSGVHWFEQAALTLAMVQAGLRWKALSRNYNFTVHGWGDRAGLVAADLREVRLLHHHNALQRATFADALRQIAASRPEVAQWLLGRGPMADPAGLVASAVGGALRLVRSRARERHLRRCRRV